MLYFPGTRIPDFSKVKRMDYDDYWAERGFSINKKLKEREEIILKRIPSGSKVLDLGAGSSRLPVALKEKGSRVTVADVSSKVLKGFAEHGIDTVELDLEKADSIHFPAKFDYIILSEVLEHTRNPEEILAAIAPFARYLCLTIPNSAFYRYRLHLMFRGRFFTQWVYHPSEHLRYWSHNDFLDWLEALGFKVLSSQSSNGFSIFGLPLYKWLPNLFGHQICYFVEPKKSG